MCTSIVAEDDKGGSRPAIRSLSCSDALTVWAFLLLQVTCIMPETWILVYSWGESVLSTGSAGFSFGDLAS